MSHIHTDSEKSSQLENLHYLSTYFAGCSNGLFPPSAIIQTYCILVTTSICWHHICIKKRNDAKTITKDVNTVAKSGDNPLPCGISLSLHCDTMENQRNFTRAFEREKYVVLPYTVHIFPLCGHVYVGQASNQVVYLAGIRRYAAKSSIA